MNKNKRCTLGVILVLILAFSGTKLHAMNGTEDGTDFYQRCASCHLENGKGVVGSFPPLEGHIDKFFGTDAGRQYLMHIILNGAQGRIDVNGNTYFGFMPNVVADLSDEELLILMNYLVQKFGTDKQKTQARVFQKSDIANAKNSRLKARSQLKALRKSALSGK